MKFIRSLLFIALLAVAGNAILPFASGDVRDGKILICTAEGYRYVDAGSIPITPHKPRCLMCVMAALNAPLAPPVAVAETISMIHDVGYALPEEWLAIPRVAHTLFTTRAPPVAV